MKVKVDNTNSGLINGMFVFPETHRQYMARLRKVSYKEFLKYKKRGRKDNILNHEKKIALAQWFEIDHCVAME